MAYDPSDRTTVLFGGRSGTQVLGDTWTFDGSTWTHRTPAASPPPLESASLAYDQASHQLILFGGEGPGGPVAASWAWDGVTWIPLSPAAAPPARYGAAMDYHDAGHVLVLFGGFASPTTPLADTWLWDGTTWTARTPAATPPARGQAGLAFDAGHGVSVLFGGTTGSQPLGDTWAWDGTSWSQQHSQVSPAPRFDMVAAGDPLLPGTVLFGGSAGGGGGTAQADTWRWDGASWAELAVAGGPPARSGAAQAFDLGAHQLLVFGGAGADGAPLGDLWSLKAGAAAPPAPATSTSGSPSRAGPAATSGSIPTTAGAPATPASRPGSLPAGKPGKASTAMALTAGAVRGGDQVTLTGGGFAPHTTVVVSFHSTPVVVGSTTADAEGRFSLTVAVPADAPAGQHHFQAEGSGPSGLDTMLVAPIRVRSLVRHHSVVVPIVMIALTLLISAAAWTATVIFPRTSSPRRGMT